jgi:hypothetical protein
MKVDLIPCPDCGAPAEVKRGRYVGTDQIYSTVHCKNFLCILFSHTLHVTAATPEESDIRAAQSWNERYAGILPQHEVNKRRLPGTTEQQNHAKKEYPA